MNKSQTLALARAIELDDEFPDDVCPGCQRNIPYWDRYPAHIIRKTTSDNDLLAKRSTRHDDTPLPFIGRICGPVECCPWTLDYLLARRFRRQFIAKHVTVAGQK